MECIQKFIKFKIESLDTIRHQRKQNKKKKKTNRTNLLFDQKNKSTENSTCILI